MSSVWKYGDANEWLNPAKAVVEPVRQPQVVAQPSWSWCDMISGLFSCVPTRESKPPASEPKKNASEPKLEPSATPIPQTMPPFPAMARGGPRAQGLFPSNPKPVQAPNEPECPPAHCSGPPTMPRALSFPPAPDDNASSKPAEFHFEPQLSGALGAWAAGHDEPTTQEKPERPIQPFHGVFFPVANSAAAPAPPHLEPAHRVVVRESTLDAKSVSKTTSAAGSTTTDTTAKDTTADVFHDGVFDRVLQEAVSMEPFDDTNIVRSMFPQFPRRTSEPPTKISVNDAAGYLDAEPFDDSDVTKFMFPRMSNANRNQKQ